MIDKCALRGFFIRKCKAVVLRSKDLVLLGGTKQVLATVITEGIDISTLMHSLREDFYVYVNFDVPEICYTV